MNLLTDSRSRARFRGKVREAQKQPSQMTVSPGRGSFSFAAAASILRTTPELLKRHFDQRGGTAPAFLDEAELKGLWEFFRR